MMSEGSGKFMCAWAMLSCMVILCSTVNYIYTNVYIRCYIYDNICCALISKQQNKVRSGMDTVFHLKTLTFGSWEDYERIICKA